MLFVALRHTAPGGAYLRLPNGSDILSVRDTTTDSAIRFIDRLLVDSGEHAIAPGEASRLTACDRDRLLFHVTSIRDGDAIQSTVSCSHCDERFDVDFSLAELADAVLAPGRPYIGPEFEVGGRSVRAPDGDDERWMASHPIDEERLLERLAPGLEGGLLAEAARVLDHEIRPLSAQLDARCPECGEVDSLPFDLQSWVLASVLNERPTVLAEAHTLARAYGWSLTEILSLTSDDRRRLADFIEREVRRR